MLARRTVFHVTALYGVDFRTPRDHVKPDMVNVPSRSKPSRFHPAPSLSVLWRLRLSGGLLRELQCARHSAERRGRPAEHGVAPLSRGPVFEFSSSPSSRRPRCGCCLFGFVKVSNRKSRLGH